jgi:hypothetical protein
MDGVEWREGRRIGLGQQSPALLLTKMEKVGQQKRQKKRGEEMRWRAVTNAQMAPGVLWPIFTHLSSKTESGHLLWTLMRPSLVHIAAETIHQD